MHFYLGASRGRSEHVRLSTGWTRVLCDRRPSVLTVRDYFQESCGGRERGSEHSQRSHHANRVQRPHQRPGCYRRRRGGSGCQSQGGEAAASWVPGKSLVNPFCAVTHERRIDLVFLSSGRNVHHFKFRDVWNQELLRDHQPPPGLYPGCWRLGETAAARRQWERVSVTPGRHFTDLYRHLTGRTLWFLQVWRGQHDVRHAELRPPGGGRGGGRPVAGGVPEVPGETRHHAVVMSWQTLLRRTNAFRSLPVTPKRQRRHHSTHPSVHLSLLSIYCGPPSSQTRISFNLSKNGERLHLQLIKGKCLSRGVFVCLCVFLHNNLCEEEVQFVFLKALGNVKMCRPTHTHLTIQLKSLVYSILYCSVYLCTSGKKNLNTISSWK